MRAQITSGGTCTLHWCLHTLHSSVCRPLYPIWMGVHYCVFLTQLSFTFWNWMVRVPSILDLRNVEFFGTYLDHRFWSSGGKIDEPEPQAFQFKLGLEKSRISENLVAEGDWKVSEHVVLYANTQQGPVCFMRLIATGVGLIVIGMIIPVINFVKLYTQAIFES